ncbi:hypothetical protein FHT86_000821 [Rhizobium sp. BK313]|uniref:GAP1-N1 domain-containing protein n=1 Tax=Rhizobium sp. BK313 TaxID=2587081 RepID=UPI00105F7735|nr:hypothetical protein [Rhizobium sp. BK313]MBB3452565.1 hypothetical protein [Rhizobium sp. BK313]
MVSDDYNAVDQAVFGYSNGHRQLRSSVSLSSVDLYELAAISDLAPGARLTASQSYLTGALLPDSKRYALIRTWLAPEMPRPGCVWSHVLLLPRPVLSSQIDLSTFHPLFRRPDDYETNNFYSSQVTVLRRARDGSRAEPDTIERLLAATYLRYPLRYDDIPSEDWERAILAIWSQQWPRLRAQFGFRSIPSTSVMRSQSFRFDEHPSANEHNLFPRWLPYAVHDANASNVTPLRRFLWRYGKDIDKPQEAFADLVNFFAMSNDPEGLPQLAEQVFQRFGDGEAETLKRDLLGLGVSSLSLVPHVRPAEMIRLVSDHYMDRASTARNEIVSLFVDIPAETVPDVAAALLERKDPLGPIAQDIFEALACCLSTEILASDRFPAELLVPYMRQRPDLIADVVLERVSTGDLFDLVLSVTDESHLVILRAILERDREAFQGAPKAVRMEAVLEVAVELFQDRLLGRGWQKAFAEGFVDFLPFVNELRSGSAVAACARLFEYPVGGPNAARTWLEGIRKSDLEYSDETRMLSFIFVLCIANGIGNNHGVLANVLPMLRPRVLAGEVSQESQDLLSRWLPHHDKNWDLDRRILKLLRRHYKDGGNVDDVVVALGLSEENLAYATNRDKEETLSLFKPFQPWSWFN